jgi:cell division protein FtsL
MNATTKVYGQRIITSRSLALPAARVRPQLRVVLLVLAILSTAFAIVYVKDLNRRLFMGYQDLKQGYNELTINNGKLLLEESALAAQARIQQIATVQQGMELPTAKNTVIVKL